MSQPYPRTAHDPGINGAVVPLDNAFNFVNKYDEDAIRLVVPANQRRRHLQIRAVPFRSNLTLGGIIDTDHSGIFFGTDINVMKAFLRNNTKTAGWPGWAIYYEVHWISDSSLAPGNTEVFWYTPPPPLEITVPDPIYAVFIEQNNPGNTSAISFMEEVNV